MSFRGEGLKLATISSYGFEREGYPNIVEVREMGVEMSWGWAILDGGCLLD